MSRITRVFQFALIALSLGLVFHYSGPIPAGDAPGKAPDSAQGSGQATPSGAVKVHIDQMAETEGGYLVALKELNGPRTLPISIGAFEARAILFGLYRHKQGSPVVQRPLTHDLLQETITKLEATLERIVITKLEFNTFFARPILKTKEGVRREVDARPSDSIAVAIRAEAPIFVSGEVLDQVAPTYGL
jgi:bifunctional DNase/RNase